MTQFVKIIRQTAQTSLQSYNYKTLLAKDGIEAIAIYAEHKKEISLVLMDLYDAEYGWINNHPRYP